MDPDRIEITDDVYLWPEQNASIHLKAVSSFGDPVELAEHEARALASALLRLADEIGK
jgi:hypothetical protein